MYRLFHQVMTRPFVPCDITLDVTYLWIKCGARRKVKFSSFLQISSSVNRIARCALLIPSYVRPGQFLKVCYYRLIYSTFIVPESILCSMDRASYNTAIIVQQDATVYSLMFIGPCIIVITEE